MNLTSLSEPTQEEPTPATPQPAPEKTMNDIAAFLEKQTAYLKTIKNILVFFLVITLLAAFFALIASCARGL
jgi:hypothetical protein